MHILTLLMFIYAHISTFTFCWIRSCFAFVFLRYVFAVCTTLFTTRKESQFLYLHKNPVSPHPCDTQLSSQQSSPWRRHCCTGWNIVRLFLTLGYRKANTEMSLALRRSHGAGWEQSRSAGQVLPLTHAKTVIYIHNKAQTSAAEWPKTIRAGLMMLICDDKL